MLVAVLGSAATLSSSTPLRADAVLPTGLAPGSRYEIAFVTYGATQATSGDIDYYNSFVTNEANKSPTLATLGVSWYAIASTADYNANEIPQAIPVYDTHGNYLTSQLFSSGLFFGFSGNANNVPGVYFDQYGGIGDTNVWTGSIDNGSGYPGYQLGTANPVNGLTYYDPGVSEINDLDQDIRTEYTYLPMFAVSAPLTATPEPSTFTLLGIGVISLVAYAWRRRRQAAA